ncbi:uncharacterized protein Dwil_GK27081 [Drosophila willistoni]|uniref:Uncharacterized protein n=1 Tax=Drosophila willistoni TaxID=7260 RepID=A0A0Q9WQI6_DROWI|nr:uncharacterized protein Dwil_GK27081 [Drosophila willistoni]
MEEKILNIALDDMALENSTSEENLDIMCPTSCCKTIKMLLLDIADGKKEMNTKLSYIKDLEEKLTKLEIKSSLFSEREQSLEGKVKDKNDVIAALKASIEIYQSIKLSDTKPNEALNEELRNIKDMLKKLTESTEVHGRQTKPEDLSLSNDIAQAS